MRAALEYAENGMRATIVEKFPTLGAQRIPTDRLIKPDQAFVNDDLDKARNHANIDILTFSDIKRIGRDNEKIKATIVNKSGRVDNSKCNDCKACIQVCPVNMADDFNEGIGFRTAVDFLNPGTGEYNVYKEDMPVCQERCPVNLDIRKYMDLLQTVNTQNPWPRSESACLCPAVSAGSVPIPVKPPATGSTWMKP